MATPHYGTFSHSAPTNSAEAQYQQSLASEITLRLERDVASHQPEMGERSLSSGEETPSTTSTSPDSDRSTSIDLERGVASSNTSTSAKSEIPTWGEYFHQNIGPDRLLEAQLFILTLSTGMIDAVTVSRYHTFVSKQTGNTIMAALWAMRHPYVDREENIGMSFAMFVFGAYVFG